MARLSALGLEALIVGIPNGGEQRMSEYSPFCDAEGNSVATTRTWRSSSMK
jgi:hypothetical protein